MVEPPTSDSIEEKCGTEATTNNADAIVRVRAKTRFQVKSKDGMKHKCVKNIFSFLKMMKEIKMI
jgi:hypothetical protein